VHRSRAHRALSGLALSVAVCACGPSQYLTVVSHEAANAVAVAHAYRADQLAPYEYTVAAECLHKARDLGGHARFEEAVLYGRRARELADKSRELALERGGKPEELEGE
jgi:hypothetical protein